MERERKMNPRKPADSFLTHMLASALSRVADHVLASRSAPLPLGPGQFYCT